MLKSFGLTVALIARAGFFDGFQLPPRTSIDNVSPAINDHGNVAFKVLSFEDGASGIVVVPFKKNSKLVYASNPELYLSDVSLSQNDQVLFTEFSEIGALGLYRYESDKLQKLLSSEELFDYSSIGIPVATTDGACVRVTRGSNSRSNREVICTAEKGEINTIFKEGPQSKASYLFTSALNDKSEFAAKIRLGARGEISEEQPDVIGLSDKDGMHILLSDRDAEASSPYVSFQNSVSLNNLGEVALIARTIENKNCLIKASRKKVEVKVCEGEQGIKNIEYFTPQINDKGSIAFRAIDTNGKRQIFLLKNSEASFRRLIGEGDSVPTDLGPGEILHRNGFPGISGNIGLNNLDQVVFHALVVNEEGRGLGAGIFVVGEKSGESPPF